MTDRKSIARILDRAAARSAHPASSKQVWFLAGLWAEQGNEVDYQDYLLDTSAALSSADASAHIEMALRQRAAA